MNKSDEDGLKKSETYTAFMRVTTLVFSPRG